MSIVVTALYCPTGKRYEFHISGDDTESIAKDLCSRLMRRDVEPYFHSSGSYPSDWVDVKVGTAEPL